VKSSYLTTLVLNLSNKGKGIFQIHSAELSEEFVWGVFDPLSIFYRSYIDPLTNALLAKMTGSFLLPFFPLISNKRSFGKSPTA